MLRSIRVNLLLGGKVMTKRHPEHIKIAALTSLRSGKSLQAVSAEFAISATTIYHWDHNPKYHDPGTLDVHAICAGLDDVIGRAKPLRARVARLGRTSSGMSQSAL